MPNNETTEALVNAGEDNDGNSQGATTSQNTSAANHTIESARRNASNYEILNKSAFQEAPHSEVHSLNNFGSLMGAGGHGIHNATTGSENTSGDMSSMHNSSTVTEHHEQASV